MEMMLFLIFAVFVQQSFALDMSDCNNPYCVVITQPFYFCFDSECHQVNEIAVPLQVNDCLVDVYCFFRFKDATKYGYLTKHMNLVEVSFEADCPT